MTGSIGGGAAVPVSSSEPSRIAGIAAAAATASAPPAPATTSWRRVKRGASIPSASRGRITQLAAALVALLGLLGERAGDHLVDRLWQLGPALVQGGRRLLEVSEHRRDRPRPLEGRLAVQAFVQDAAERVDVGARVERLAGDLLGGGVVDRAGEVRGVAVVQVVGAAGEPEVGEVAVLLRRPPR